jgi:hypothetical protein
VCGTMGNALTRIKFHIYLLLGGMPDEIRTAMLIEIQNFWKLRSCLLANNYRRFGIPYSLRLQGTAVQCEVTYPESGGSKVVNRSGTARRQT